MVRDRGAYVADMIEACDRAIEYARRFGAEALKADPNTIDAIVRNLAVLGEAA